MADDVQTLFIFTGNDCYGCVGSDRGAQILCCAVYGDGQSRLCKTRTNFIGNVKTVDTALHIKNTAVRQFNRNHF